ncbi:VOC family protein [Haloarcula litorea]|uniref:VOC family protein n=1 Tax=Haloarcula litorea TaxID=3032579 RepID=UPI0023E7BC4B|nr:VOC family protein [Halomicroarcula sp. GDY20]
MDTNGLPQGARVGRTALTVSDREEMTEFYRRVVGLSMLDKSPTTTVLGVDGDPLLILEEHTDSNARPGPTTGLFHIAFRVPSRGALGDALERIREHWQLDGSADHRVSEALYVTDPEGNGVEIYRDFPEADWSVADDGSIRLGNDPLDVNEIAAVAAGETQAPPETDIGHLHLEVSSLDEFKRCYVDTLGFEVKSELKTAVFVSAGRYHHRIAANTGHNKSEPRRGRGLSWFEIVLPEASSLESLRTRLAASQWTITELEESISITDSDGIEIRFRQQQ